MGFLGSLVVVMLVAAVSRAVALGVLTAFPQLKANLMPKSTGEEAVAKGEHGVRLFVTVLAVIFAMLVVFLGKYVGFVLLAALVGVVLFGVARKVSRAVEKFTVATLSSLEKAKTKAE